MLKQYTLADANEVRDWFSDAYKEVNGFRPRGYSDEAMIHWVNTTDVNAEIREQEEREAEWLAEMGFKTMDDYYAYLDRKHDAKFAGLPTPLTPAQQQLKDDQAITALEALDPQLMGYVF